MKIIIIGYGHAGQAYLSACVALKKYEKITVVDLDYSQKEYVPNNVRFCTKLPDEKFDLAIVATPPETHLEVLNSVHSQVKRTILEKPFAITQSDIDAIFELASKGRIFFSIHARYGKEISFAQEAIASSRFSKCTNITQLYCDPYWPDGPKNLGGPFWDSIYNAVGVLNSLFRDVSLSNIQVTVDRENMFDVNCVGEYRHGEFEYRLTVDWGRGLNFKVTEMTDELRNDGLLINHSQQCISSLSGLRFEYSAFKQSRLSEHYKAVVTECLDLENLGDNNKMAKCITEQVLQILKAREK